MDKVKAALTVLTIVIIIGPLAGVTLAYRNNLAGLVYTPQVKSLVKGVSSSSSLTNGTQASPLAQSIRSISNFTLPRSKGHPQYNPTTGAFSDSFNFTNPLTTQISIDNLTAEVVSENNVPLGNVTIQPINIAPSGSAIINATGNLSPSAISQLKSQYVKGTLKISLENITMDIGGITVHLNKINNIGSIPTTG